ncbi:hypothetical protein PYW07_000107 [Mythimna separata]|uniref:Uncharacterized protein n=1 Tax=Mythimna separata TaxID=271217 RepID=A0AAD7Z462_MYTSE|nr:hypothetical protein PYW07_000107 [Mythimna separata]
MFEVMKGLYDCYKAKNCDGCECVLCGHKAAEEKKLAELRKSMTSAARNKVLEGKTPDEKEFILKEMAKTRQPLPSGKTASEKALIDKTRKELGLPPSPKNLLEKSKMRKAEAAGIITPLEGKTPEQKEKILRVQAAMGLPLPEGRTDSEKALIEKVKATKKRSLKTALLTPLTGKTPEEKEKILRGRAMKGLPLPEAASASEKKLIDKVRADLGLPKDPTTKSMKEKHEQAAKAGLLQPLEGKTPEEKEKTLKGLRSLGIPLPEGRTPSEKALIAKVKASPRSLVAASEQLRKAKAEGLLTPLAGKTPEQKEKILKGLALKGLPLPEAKSPSEKKLIAKVRADLGLPKEPDTKSMKEKHEQAAKAGLLQPLEGKTPEEKEKTLKGLHELGIPLPEGRTPSEKALVAKVKSTPAGGSIKTEAVMTPLAGKTPEVKEKILKARAKKGIPLPEGTTPSEKQIIDKVRADLGLPKEPDTKSMKAKHEQAAKAGLLEPLEGKTPAQKEAQLKGLRDMGIPLPEGRTPSEKALIAKVKEAPRSMVSPSEQLRRAKAEGLMTPLAGKTPAQKEKILKGLAMKGIPLPEGKSTSEKKLIDKVRDDLGLPKEPDTKSMKDKYEQAAKAGLLQPLVGKTPEEKEKILQGQHDLGIPLPEGRTPSEKALIAKIKALPPAGSIKTAGIMTPLAGKAPALKEKVLRARAKKGIPLPEGTTPSEKKIIDKVRADLGLPKEPDTKSMKAKHEQAAKAGLLEPLEGKTPAQKEAQLKGLRDMGIPLPEGRTPSEKALIAKVKEAPRSMVSPSEQLRRAKAEGLMSPLAGKTPAQKEKILKGLAMKGLPLPEGKSPSEKKLIDKVRDDLGLPKEPDTKSMKAKHEQAAKFGLLQPLVGKTPEEKEKILQGQHDLGIALPEGRTPSEKALIAKVKALPPEGSIKTAGIMTPLAGKAPALKEKVLRARAKKGIPLPEGTTPSEKKIIDKVRADLGLPKEPDTKSMKAKHELAAKFGLLEPLEGKTPAQKEAQLKGLRDMGIPLPEGRTPSEKDLIAKVKYAPRSMVSPSEQLRRAKAEGLMTPLAGKTPEQKERILKGLVLKGLPLPESKTPSEKKIIDKVRKDLGLPKEPDTKSMKAKHKQAEKFGLLEPLEGKTRAQKEAQLKGLRDMGIPLPEGRTLSEKDLIAKIKYAPRSMLSPSEQLRRAKEEGLMTPLTGKTPAQKEKILKGLVMKGIPLPESKTPSEKKISDKVRAELGLPKEPDTKSMKAKHEQAAKAGLLEPLEGKTTAQKEAQLKGLRDLGIPLPEGRTPSEKALIAKVTWAPRSLVSPSEQLRRAKAEGLMTPLAGKTPAQKEKILKGLAMKGIPLPEAKSSSEKKLIDKVRNDLGLPKVPVTKSMKDKYEQAAKAGLLKPLVGKTPEEKEKILQGQHDLGIPLPEGRTPSEKALIAKIKASPPAGIMTPLAGKAPSLKEKVLRARAMKGIPLPEGTTPSEKKIINKVRADLGLPKEPDTKSMKAKHEQAAKAGLLEPLEGKTPAQKEAQLKGLRDIGIPLPEGRTPSEKALIAKVKGAPRSMVSPSEQLRRAKAEGLMTPLAGKTPAQKEKILKGLAMKGIPLPEGKSPSEKKLIDKVRDDLGLPKEPDTKSMKSKYDKAAKAGFLQPLVGKTPEEKERILQGQHDLGIPLPEGRTPSEKALIAKVKASPPAGSIKTAGLMTPLAGKPPAQQEKVLRARAMKGIPLPDGATPSEKKVIDKVRADLGLPKEPDTKSMKAKHEQAAKAGLLEPLEGKTPAQKEAQLKGLRDMGIPLPEGRTPSEKALIAKVKAAPKSLVAPSEQMRRAKAEGLMTPLTGKTPAQKEKILKGLAMKGLPLPEGKSPSEKKLIDKVRDDLGLPKEPDTKSMKEKHEQAAKAGFLQPLVGKTPEEKEKILQGQHDLGIPLPEGRTPSEKALIDKIKASPPAGLMTPLAGKTPAQKEKVLRARAMKGVPLPEGVTPSEKKIIDKVRADLGLPKEPDTKSMKAKHEQAAKAGFLEPLEGKTPAQKEAQLKGLRDMGIPLPEGRTPSEKALIDKVKAAPKSLVAPSEQMRRAKAEGLMTPLTGKTPAQKEKILKGLAMKGIPLPEAKSPSEKQLIDKVRDDLGLPKEPDTKSMKDKYEQAAKAGLLQPLVGKTPAEKEKILQGQHDLGIPLPEGRTPSEKALIAKVKASPPAGSIKTAGLMTPLAGKTPAQKEKVLRARAMKGIPLPEGATPSEKKVIDKVRADLGLPKEPDTKSMKAKHEQAAKAGLLEPLEGKTPAQKEAQLKGLRDMGIPLPEGRTPSEKALIDKVKAAPKSLVAPSEQMRRAKAEGLMTPLTGKTPAQKEKILKGLAMKGIPLPEAKSPSEKQLIDKVRDDLGLPKEPDTKSMKDKYEQAAKAGFLQPLVGKTPEEKEKILQGQHDLGIPLPEGRTPSEKALIAKVKASPPAGSIKTAGLMTPLAGKTPAQKEKVLRARAIKGIPLPEGATPSEKKVIDKVRAVLGLPKEPDTKSMKAKHEQAAKAGLLEPLEGKTPAQKEAQLKGLRDMGIPLPEGRTPSEKALIDKVKAAPKSLVAPSEQMRRAKAEGLMTPLTGKTPAQKEKILKGLAMKGIPLPEAKSPSEKQLIDKVRDDLGLPKEPDTKSMKDKYEQAAKAGLLQPLVGKTPEEKEKILQGQHDLGIPLPEGRTPSEKALIAKVKASPPAGSIKTAGLMTPLAGKTPAQKEKVLRALAKKGIPLPEGTTPSEKKIIDKVRADLGLPKEPDTKSMKAKHEQAAKAGLLEPLEGKTPAQKEAQLKGLRDMGIPLPEGRTPSEKALIAKVKAAPRSLVSPSEQLRRAKAEGLMTPLAGKSPAQKEKILKGLAMKGIPLPEGKSPSEKKLIDKVRDDLGLPKEPDTKSMKDKYEQAAKAGLLQPLVGKTPEEKEKILQGQHDLGIPLPEGRTPSEKALIAKVKASKRKESMPSITTEKLKQAKAAGLLTPLAGKTPEEKKKILQGLAQTGLPLPEGKTPSEKELIDKVKEEFGIPDRTPSEKLRKAKAAGLFTPLEGKTPAQKEKILRGRIAAGLPLPTDHTPADRALLKKIKDETGYVTPSASEKLRRAKAAGLLTPLEGKSPEEQEKILKGLAEAGLPLPEGKTKSEKSMIAKIKARTPPEGKTPSEKSIIGKAKAAGLFTPITGKAPAEKERILKGLADAGLPLPEGKTASEKELVKKIRAEAGLTPEPTPSEKKGKIRKKEKKVGVSASKKAAGIAAESFQDIIKTTKCDRGCGCDRKKIRFKHSYVKIRVTSPDISSFCDCPDECFPGVKNGAFIDNDGIKVTIGSAVGIPSYSMVCINQETPDKMVSNTDVSKRQTNYYNNVNMLKNSKYKFSSFESGLNNNKNKVNAYPNVSSSDISYSTKLYNTHSENNFMRSRVAHNQGRTCKPKNIEKSFKDRQSFEDIYKKPISETKSASSSETILIIRNDMSLSTCTSNSTGSFSLTSNMDSSITSSSEHYSGYQSTNDFLSINSLDGLTSR